MWTTDVLTGPTLEFDHTHLRFCHSISRRNGTFHLSQRGSLQVDGLGTVLKVLADRCPAGSVLETGVNKRDIEGKYYGA